MAEILVKWIDGRHPDAAVDRRGTYKRGYPVVVMPDGHEWGNAERLPIFVVVQFPGVSVERLRSYVTSQTDSRDEGGVYRRRLWRIRFDAMPSDMQAILEKTGQLVVASKNYRAPHDIEWSEFAKYLRNQETGADETKDI